MVARRTAALTLAALVALSNAPAHADDWTPAVPPATGLTIRSTGLTADPWTVAPTQDCANAVSITVVGIGLILGPTAPAGEYGLESWDRLAAQHGASLPFDGQPVILTLQCVTGSGGPDPGSVRTLIRFFTRDGVRMFADACDGLTDCPPTPTPTPTPNLCNGSPDCPGLPTPRATPLPPIEPTPTMAPGLPGRSFLLRVPESCPTGEVRVAMTCGGVFSLSVPPAQETVFGSPTTGTEAGINYLASSAAVAAVTVTDTRLGLQPWRLSGQLSDFVTATGATLPARYAGWEPAVMAGQGVVPAPAVIPGYPIVRDGLAVSRLLASVPAGHGADASGTSATIGGRINVRLPMNAPQGDYRTTLTLTLLG